MLNLDTHASPPVKGTTLRHLAKTVHFAPLIWGMRAELKPQKCPACDEPFGPYRKSFNGVCGDCAGRKASVER